MSNETKSKAQNIGASICRLRKAQGIDQLELASQAGINIEKIRNFEDGTESVSATELWKLSDVLGVRPSTFFDATH